MTASYEYDSSGKVTEKLNEISEPQHWKLNTLKSSITDTHWSLTFARSDTARLGLGQGREMTIYLAVIESFATEEASESVMIRWQGLSYANASNLDLAAGVLFDLSALVTGLAAITFALVI